MRIIVVVAAGIGLAGCSSFSITSISMPSLNTGLELALARSPDLLVLDLMLPGMDGLEVCRQLRQTSSVPIIMLTALGQVSDRVVGLEYGADDYVVKPFSPRELALRVGRVLDRARATTGPVAPPTPQLMTSADGEMSADATSRIATNHGQEMSLTAREFDLLYFLLQNPGRVFGRGELMEKVWGWSFGDQSTVTVHVRRLREKIEIDPARPARIVTVWGVGYRLEPAVGATDRPEPAVAGRNQQFGQSKRSTHDADRPSRPPAALP